uniref:Immunoglobulin domain-containing protein n=1 Tax=Mola mola TaxID=94237 RepID=A0A3Q3VQL3_MOLML
MRIFLPLLCALCAPPIHGVFYGTCHRKDPSPGTLVLSPGQELVLTCSGRVIVDGVKIRNSSNASRKNSSPGTTQTTPNIRSHTGDLIESAKHTTENAVSHGYSNHTNLTVAREPRGLGGTDTGYTAPPTAHIQPTTGEDDSTEEDEEEQKEGSRVTRDIKLRPYWNWMGRTVGKADRGVTGRTGATLSLSSLSLADSGTYTCQRGRERFSLKVIVTDPVEKPILFCYKKSPSSKIRCESVPQGPVTIKPNCHLLIGKSQTEAFLPSRCSYSSQASRCWCTLDHNEDELRTVHVAYLCVTSVAGNATSNLLTFTPMSIRKWVCLIPRSSVLNDETNHKKHGSTHLPFSLALSLSHAHTNTLSWVTFGSVRDFSSLFSEVPPTFTEDQTEFGEVSTYVLWIFGAFALLSVMLAVYIIRHKDRFVSKLQSLSFVPRCGGSTQSLPSAPAAPEGQALVTLGPPRFKEPEGDNEDEEQQADKSTESLHFNNTSYFFLQR